MPLTVTLLGFELEELGTWAISDSHYPPYLRVPKRSNLRKMVRGYSEEEMLQPITLDYMQFDHTGPLPGTYRRVK